MKTGTFHPNYKRFVAYMRWLRMQSHHHRMMPWILTGNADAFRHFEHFFFNRQTYLDFFQEHPLHYDVHYRDYCRFLEQILMDLKISDRIVKAGRSTTGVTDPDRQAIFGRLRPFTLATPDSIVLRL